MALSVRMTYRCNSRPLDQTPPAGLLNYWRVLCRVCLQVDPAKVIILEGILVLHIPELREQCSMRIYVDTGQHTGLCAQ